MIVDKIKLPYLDIMIQYSCNLSCRGCITMTDYMRKGSVSLKQGQSWIDAWSKQIDPEVVCLFGGEPLMNKDIDAWIRHVRQVWPKSTIKIISNGMYLKQKDILPTLLEVGNAVYQISLHWRTGPVVNEIKKNLIEQVKQHSWKMVGSDRDEVIMAFWHETVTVQLAIFGEFVQPYQGHGKDMKPWDSTDISTSYANCGSPRNPILYKNRIYKCGPIANLKDTLELHGLLDDPNWQTYLEYQGYGLDDNLNELQDNFDKPHAICSMCSSNRTLAEVDHYSAGAVVEKKEIKWH